MIINSKKYWVVEQTQKEKDYFPCAGCYFQIGSTCTDLQFHYCVGNKFIFKLRTEVRKSKIKSFIDE